MEQSKIEIIYQIIIKRLPLTTQVLMEHNLTQEDIAKLIEENMIKQLDTNKFELLETQGLYNYGIKLFLSRNAKSAYQCFLKCFELDNSNRECCMQLMLLQLKLGQISKAFEYFPYLDNISEEKDVYDNNLYLYLFNLLTRCPEEYVTRLQNIDYDSFLYPRDIKVPFKGDHNSIRQLIIKNKMKKALHLQNNIIAKKIKYSVADEMLKELIIRVVNLEYRFKNQLLEFAQSGNYQSIVSFLTTKSKKRYLTNEETYTYLISKSMIEMLTTETIPPLTNANPNNVYEAISGNNFAQALHLETEILQFYKHNPDENLVYILLSQINELISQLNQHSQETPAKTFIKK